MGGCQTAQGARLRTQYDGCTRMPSDQIDGVLLEEAWNTRVTVTLRTRTGEQPLFYLGLASLIRNKEASGRPKDSEDLEFLGRLAR